MYKPGVVALRPLSLGDIYDGAFKTIRRNPKAMVGMAALVVAACSLLPALLSVVLATTGNLTMPTAGESGVAGSGTPELATLLGSLTTALGQIVLAGMISSVVFGAVLGRATSIGEAWAAVHGRFWRLIGLTLLGTTIALLPMILVLLGAIVLGFALSSVGVGILVGVLGFLGSLVWVVFVGARLLSFATPAMVIERLGVVASMRRTWALSSRQFWRIFGIYLLTTLMVGIAGGMLTIPFTIVGIAAGVAGGGSTTSGLIYVFSNLLGGIVVGAVTSPFQSGVMALLYLDERIRKEGYDVQLIAAAQSGSPATAG